MEAAFYGTLFTGLILLGISAVKSYCRRLAGGGGGDSRARPKRAADHSKSR